MTRLVLSILGLLATGSAQDSILASQRQASALLERSIAAHGGYAALSRAATFDMSVRAQRLAVHQSETADGPMLTYTVASRYVTEPGKTRFLVESDLRFPSFRLHTRLISLAGKGQWVDLMTRTATPEDSELHHQPLFQRLLPQGVLSEAAQRRATLRRVSRRPGTQAFSYSRSTGEVYTVVVDSRNGLVASVEYLQQDGIDGDTTVVHSYGGYRKAADMIVPASYAVRRGPWLITQATIESLRIGEAISDQDFMLPAGTRTLQAAGLAMRFETLAPGIHFVRDVPGGYNVLVVEFADHVVVLETPEANNPNGTSRRVIALIRENLPAKPIRYAIPTHHHGDHVGGIREYIAEGVTIVTTAANEKFVRRVAAQSFGLKPDTLTERPLPIKLELIQGRGRTFQDETQELQVLRMDPSPAHVQEMLIGYLPRHRWIYQTDMFNPWSCFKEPVHHEDLGHTSALADGQALIGTIAGLGIEVDVVLGGHGREVSYGWLRAHTDRRAGDGLPLWACTAPELIPSRVSAGAQGP